MESTLNNSEQDSSRPDQPEDSPQVSARALLPDDLAYLRMSLSRASVFVGTRLPAAARDVQTLYDTVFETYPDHDNVIESIGLLFGELICEETDFEWQWVTYEGREELSLLHPSAFVFCSPLSMMHKRIQHGEAVDIEELCAQTIKTLNDLLEDVLTSESRNNTPS